VPPATAASSPLLVHANTHCPAKDAGPSTETTPPLAETDNAFSAAPNDECEAFNASPLLFQEPKVTPIGNWFSFVLEIHRAFGPVK